MEDLDPVRTVISRMRDLRRKRGLTAERLAEKMTEVGIPWQAGVVTKLEKGHRKSLGVDEFIALAYVLDVAPVHLAVPTADDDAAFMVAPGLSQRTRQVRHWFRGFAGLDGTDQQLYMTEVPRSEFPGIWIRPVAKADAAGERAVYEELIAQAQAYIKTLDAREEEGHE